MFCFFHPPQPATVACKGCGRPLCQACIQSACGRIMCVTCLAQSSAAIPGPVVQQAPVVIFGGQPLVPQAAPHASAPSSSNGQWLRELVETVAGRRGSAASLALLVGGALVAAGLAGMLELLVLMSGSPALVLAAGVVASLLAIGLGGTMSLRSLRNLRQGESRELEVEVLRLARQSGGRLTVPDVVLGTRLSVSEAEELLQRMTRSGHVTLEVDEESGALRYTVPSMALTPRSAGSAGGSSS